MGFKSFIANVKDSLGIKVDIKDGKKRSLNNLLEKLERKEFKLNKKLSKKKHKKNKEEIKQELQIVQMQIKKCKKVLNKLEDK